MYMGVVGSEHRFHLRVRTSRACQALDLGRRRREHFHYLFATGMGFLEGAMHMELYSMIIIALSRRESLWYVIYDPEPSIIICRQL